jgi:ParB/RepB/Spo0J family partition protein
VPLNKILIRDGFNKRQDYEGIEELSESIHQHGLQEPLILDVLEDGRYFIEQGHRRHKALSLLLQQELITEDHLVEFFPNKKEVTELQRMLNQYTSNNHQMPLKPLEQAAVVRDVKYNYGKQHTHEELAKMFGVSRQKIDNLIMFAEAPDDLKVQMKDMKFTKAVEFLRATRNHEKDADKVEQDAGQSAMYVAAEGKDVNAEELKELETLEKEIALNKSEEEQLKEDEELIAKSKEQEEKELKKLQSIADKIEVNRPALEPYFGKKLAEKAIKTWTEDFIDEGTGDVVSIQRNEVVVLEDTELNNETLITLMDEGVTEVWLYKVNPVAPSVITEPPAQREKDKYDTDRIEIQQIQNIIKLLDKSEVIADKIPDSQTSGDLVKIIGWMRKDALELRDWVHSNKKQNKIR